MMKKKDENRQKAGLNDRLGFFDLEPPKIYREASDKTRERGASKKTAKSKTEIRRAQDKKRKRKRKFRKALAAVIIVLLLAGAGIVLSLTVFFKIETITPSGSGIYSSDEITAACGIEIDDNLFLIDKEDTAERIKTALPWAYSVNIKRSLPSEVKIVITDAIAAYAVKNEDKTYILLDDNFKVLEKASKKRISGTVLIACDKILNANEGYQIEFENSEVSDALSRLAESIKSTSFTQATKIKSNGTDDNYIIYDSRITFKLGSLDNLESKIYRGLSACKKLDESNPGIEGTLDLTYDKEIYFTGK